MADGMADGMADRKKRLRAAICGLQNAKRQKMNAEKQYNEACDGERRADEELQASVPKGDDARTLMLAALTEVNSEYVKFNKALDVLGTLLGTSGGTAPTTDVKQAVDALKDLSRSIVEGDAFYELMTALDDMRLPTCCGLTFGHFPKWICPKCSKAVPNCDEDAGEFIVSKCNEVYSSISSMREAGIVL